MVFLNAALEKEGCTATRTCELAGGVATLPGRVTAPATEGGDLVNKRAEAGETGEAGDAISRVGDVTHGLRTSQDVAFPAALNISARVSCNEPLWISLEADLAGGGVLTVRQAADGENSSSPRG